MTMILVQLVRVLRDNFKEHAMSSQITSLKGFYFTWLEVKKPFCDGQYGNKNMSFKYTA